MSNLDGALKAIDSLALQTSSSSLYGLRSIVSLSDLKEVLEAYHGKHEPKPEQPKGEWEAKLMGPMESNGQREVLESHPLPNNWRELLG